MLFQLDDDWVRFPDPHLAEPDGLLALGGRIDTEWLSEAYRNGIFPFFACGEDEVPLWYSPHERFVIFPSEIHVSHSMRTLLNKGSLHVSFNKDFEGVIGNCSRLRIHEDGAWLGGEMVNAYIGLHRLGRAASVEVWEEGNLVGGLYGVTVGHAFCGESMFSLRPSASKVALIALADRLASFPRGPYIIDCQFETPHLRNMGGRFIPYDEFASYLV